MMRWLDMAGKRLRSVAYRARVEQELDEEMRFHVEHQTAEYVAQGMSAGDARQRALRAFGGVAQLEEECRDQRRVAWVEEWLRDIRHAARSLRRAPGFTAVAVVTLALGIGTTSALFSVIDAVLLKPLPLPEPERLVWLEEFRDGNTSGGNPARLRDWQGASSFAAAAGFYSDLAVWTGRDMPERLSVLRTFGGIVPTLGATPALGRGPTPDEEKGDGQPVALLTHRTWQGRFQSDPRVLGGTLVLSGLTHQIIGVLPSSAEFPDDVDVWAPAPREFHRAPRVAGFLGEVARLKPGVVLTQAQAELDTIAAGLARQYPDTDRHLRVRLVPLQQHLTREARTPLLVLFGAMALVLLVACLNVAGLLMARGLARQREASIRMALGAGKARVVRLFLVESLLIALAGGVLGLAVAYAGVDLLKLLLPSDLPRLAAATLDGRVAAFAALVSVACALVAGFAPAWQVARGAAATGMKEGTGGAVGAPRAHLRSALVVAEVALSVLLLVGAGLLAQSLARMTRVPLGFAPEGALSFTVNLPWGTPQPKLDNFARDLTTRLLSLPGVRAAGVVDRLPLQGGSQSGPVAVRGRTLSPELAVRPAGWRMASAGAFRALGVPLLAGELFPDRYDPQASRQVVVNDAFARAYFGAESPIGREIARPAQGNAPAAQATWYRIVGVVGGVRQDATEAVPSPEVYRPWGADYWPMMSFAVRTQGDPGSLAPAVREAVRQVDSEQFVDQLQPLGAHVSSSRATPRTRTWLVSGVALVALLLAAIGLYGLLAAEMVRRQQEFGLRLALGAAPAQLVASALKRGMMLAALGLAVGLPMALWASRALESLLFGVRPRDAATLAEVALVLLLVAALASYGPARRAATVDPVTVLRQE